MTHSLIAALQNPELYPHQVDSFQVIETHISWVILTGPYAYKIKKPVDFGFLDFTSLQARKHFCNEEVRLNQRLTQGLYLEVVPITGQTDNPELGGNGQAIEYAIRMRQFPQTQLLSEIQKHGGLSEIHIDALALQVAQFHLKAPRITTEHPLCNPQAIMNPVQQNFTQIRPMLVHAEDLQQLDTLQAWAEDSFARLFPLLEQRCANGSIRECHGDIHLGNATMLDGQAVLFDCIEFNEAFRLIDIASDTAFLAMDLEDRGLKQLARRYINTWLEQTGDYQCTRLLNFYKAYRAMVRAKVNLFRLAQEEAPEEKTAILRQYRSYTSLAESYCAIPTRFLAITHGLSAVGKSTVAMRMVESLGAIHLRSDFERKRLFGEQEIKQQNTIGSGIYNKEASDATYHRLHQLAQQVLQAGFPVIIDATYLHGYQRQKAHEAAQSSGVPFLILDCQASQASMTQRLKQRQKTGQDISDATLEVIAAQQAGRESLDTQERLHSLVINTDEITSLDTLAQHIQQRLPGL